MVRGGAAGWPALTEWSFTSLRAQYGEQVQNRLITEGEPIFGDDGECMFECGGCTEIKPETQTDPTPPHPFAAKQKRWPRVPCRRPP